MFVADLKATPDLDDDSVTVDVHVEEQGDASDGPVADEAEVLVECENDVVASATGDLDGSDDLHAGSVEGWLANWSSPLVVRDRGDGKLCGCTFRVTDAYGDHPTATALVDRLVRTL